MHDEPKFFPQRGTSFYADGRSVRPQVENTVARNQLHEDSYFYTGKVGANPGDAVAPGWPALPTGVFGIMLVSGTNTITVRLCNLSGLEVTPPSASYRATIVRNY